MLLALLLLPAVVMPHQVQAAPLFGESPCPPIEKPTATTTTPTTPKATPAIGNTPTTPTTPITSIGGGPLFSSAGNFTFKAPDVVAASKVGDRTQLILFVVNILLLVATVMFIILIPIGGLKWLSAAGNEEASTQARRLLLNAVIGLFLTLAAQAIGNIILRQFGVNYSFTEAVSQISRPSAPSGGGSTEVPPGSRSVKFRLVALSASDGQPLPDLNLTLIGPRNSVVGSVATGSDGSAETSVTVPIEATTINIYRSGDQSASGSDLRLDTVLGTFTIGADYTSYGCVSVELSTINLLVPVSLTIQQPVSFRPSGSALMTITIVSGIAGEPEQSFAIAQTGGQITANLHPETTYQVRAVVPGYSTTRGSFITPSYDTANPTRTVLLTD